MWNFRGFKYFLNVICQVSLKPIAACRVHVDILEKTVQ